MEMLLVGLIFVAGFGAGCAVYGLMRHLQDLEQELIELRERAGKRPSNFLIAGTEDVTATLTEDLLKRQRRLMSSGMGTERCPPSSRSLWPTH